VATERPLDRQQHEPIFGHGVSEFLQAGAVRGEILQQVEARLSLRTLESVQ
jgi:hypothetical protein